MNKSELAVIKKELANGNNRWLGELYENYKPYCIATLRSKRKISSEESNDLFSEALLILYKHVLSGKVTELSAPKTYLVSICINLARNVSYYENRAAKKVEEVRLLFYDNHINIEDDDDQDIDLLKQCMDALKSLTERCQKIIKAYYLDRMRMKEIAQLLDLSSADVAKTLKSRCFKSLVEKIDSKG